MTAPDNGQHRYEIGYSALIKQAIRRAHHRASRQGRGEAFTEALRKVVERLEIDPLEAGEPIYQLPILRIRIRKMVVRPVVVEFGVFEDRPIVIIKSVKLLSAN